MTAAAVEGIPEGYHTVTPWIISRDTAGLIEFMTAGFGAEEIARVEMENGTIGLPRLGPAPGDGQLRASNAGH